jgi:hypothetical protein
MSGKNEKSSASDLKDAFKTELVRAKEGLSPSTHIFEPPEDIQEAEKKGTQEGVLLKEQQKSKEDEGD